jgi:hypothetical protein
MTKQKLLYPVIGSKTAVLMMILVLVVLVGAWVVFANSVSAADSDFPDMPVINDATCWKCHANFAIINDRDRSSTVVSGGQHPISSSCLNCHSQSVANLAAFRNCTWCHYDNIPNGRPRYMSYRHTSDGANSFQNLPDRRHTISTLHDSANTSCSTCHSTILTDEHYRANRSDIDGDPITCNTCHTATYLGDESSTNGILKILKTEIAQIVYSQVWFTPSGLTTSRIYVDHLMATGDYAEIYALYNGQWGLVYRATGLQSKWLDLPAETTALKTKMSSPATIPTTYWGLDVPKVTLTPTSENAFYQAIQTAITNQDTSCESCHGQESHKHLVGAYDQDANSTCNSCHATDPTTKGTELSKLHSDKGHTCDSCHANSQIEGTIIVEDGVMNIPVCATCHNGVIAPLAESGHQSIDHPVTTYEANVPVNCSSCHTTQSTTGSSADLAKLHSNNCNSCHNNTLILEAKIIDGDGVVDPVPTCSTCHNGTMAPLDSTKHQSHDSATGYGSYTYDGSVNCSICHSSLQVTGAHNSSVNCNTCHSSTVPAVTEVISKNLSTVTSKTPYTCSDCHNSLPNKHQEKHLASTFEAFGDSNCVSCHSKDLAQTHDPIQVNCNTCHGDAATQAVKDTIAANISSVIATPQYSCSSCHTGPHPSFEHTVSSYEVSTNVNCASCHATDQATGGTDLAKLHNSNCDLCHKNPSINGSIIDNDGVVDAIPNCSKCHYGTIAPKADTKHSPRHTANNYTTATSWTSDTSYGCASCHTNKDVTTQHKSLLPNCNICHSSTASTTVKNVISANLSTNTVRTGFDCTSCHSSLHTTRHQSANIYCARCHIKVSSDLRNYSMSSHSSCTQCHKNLVFTNPSAEEITLKQCQSYCHRDDSHFQSQYYINKGCAPCHIPTDKSFISNNPFWGHYFKED